MVLLMALILLVIEIALDITESIISDLVFIHDFPYCFDSILNIERGVWSFVSGDLVFSAHLLYEHLQLVIIMLRQPVFRNIGQSGLISSGYPITARSHT